MAVDPALLKILACPQCKKPVVEKLEADSHWLVCEHCARRYPVRDNIPVMLVDESQPLSQQ